MNGERKEKKYEEDCVVYECGVDTDEVRKPIESTEA